MKIVIVEPCAQARVEEIGGSLREMQQIVGGNIEGVPFEENPKLCVVCNDEGKLIGLEDNFVNSDDIICGTAFICRHNGIEFEGLTDEEAEFVCEILNSKEE